MRTIHKKKQKKSIGHVKCTFGNAAENFSQRAGQLSLKVQKLSKISENTIIVLKVVHWTRRKQFWQFCWKLFAGSSRHFASKSKINWKEMFLQKISSKNSSTFRMQFWQNWRNFFWAVWATLLKLFARGPDDYRSKSENTFEKLSKKDNLSHSAPLNM